MDDWEKFNETSLPGKKFFPVALIWKILPVQIAPTQAAFKKTKLKLDLLTYISMLLMLEKGIRGGICHSVC